jgi:hypothetical protein
MPPRTVSIGHGLKWIAGGWETFKRNPVGWSTLTGLLLAICVLLLNIPLLGPLLFNLLFPVFFAGLMLGCRAMEQGGKLEFGHLFAGFRENASALVSVGGVYLLGMLIVVAIVSSSGSLPRMPEKPTPEDVTALQKELHNMRGGILAGLLVMVPVLMLTWFAPLLIVFRGMTVLPALRASLNACLRNVGAFLLYGLIVVLLWIAATLPMAGGARNALSDILTILALIVVLSVIFGSIYASYRDIFEPPANGSPPG